MRTRIVSRTSLTEGPFSGDLRVGIGYSSGSNPLSTGAECPSRSSAISWRRLCRSGQPVPVDRPRFAWTVTVSVFSPRYGYRVVRSVLVGLNPRDHLSRFGPAHSVGTGIVERPWRHPSTPFGRCPWWSNDPTHGRHSGKWRAHHGCSDPDTARYRHADRQHLAHWTGGRPFSRVSVAAVSALSTHGLCQRP